MRPDNWWNMENIEPDQMKWSSLSSLLKQFYTILNKGIIPKDNWRGSQVVVTFSAPDVDTEVEHGLSYIPQYYIVFDRNASFVVYRGAGLTTSKFIYLRASAVGTATVFIF